MSEIITCPSGLKGRIRKMKVHEARSFSSRTKGRAGDPTGRLLAEFYFWRGTGENRIRLITEWILRYSGVLVEKYFAVSVASTEHLSLDNSVLGNNAFAGSSFLVDAICIGKIPCCNGEHGEIQ